MSIALFAVIQGERPFWSIIYTYIQHDLAHIIITIKHTEEYGRESLNINRMRLRTNIYRMSTHWFQQDNTDFNAYRTDNFLSFYGITTGATSGVGTW